MKVYDFYITPEEYEIASSRGIKKNNLDTRIRLLGWDKERALTEPLNFQDRQCFGDYIKIAKDNGISKSTFTSRVNKMGWSYEKASSTPVMKKNPNTQYSEDIHRIRKKHGISKMLFYNRIRKGCDVMKSATHPKIKPDASNLHGVNSGFKEGNRVYWECR